MANSSAEQVRRYDAKAARRLNAVFKNDKNWCMESMTAEGRLLAFNVTESMSQAIVLVPENASSKVILRYDQSASTRITPQQQQKKQDLPSPLSIAPEQVVSTLASHDRDTCGRTTDISGSKKKFIQIKDVLVYEEKVSDAAILSGGTEQIRGPNVLRLAGKYSDTGLARAINEAQPPGTTPLSVDNVYERIKSACKYVEKSRSGSDKLWEQVREEMVYVSRRGNGIVVKRR